MKYSKYLSIFLFYFCFGRIEAEPFISALSILDSKNSLTIPLVPCIIVEALILYVSLICYVLALGGNASAIIASIAAKLGGVLGTTLLLTFNTIRQATDALGTPCYETVNYWTESVNGICPEALNKLNVVMLELAKQGNILHKELIKE